MNASAIRMPVGAAAQLRGDLRRYGVRNGARRWGLRQRDALLIVGGLSAPRSAVLAVLARVVKLADIEAERRRGRPEERP